ncbi:hypothetical protein [Bifidobacterium simiarum]|uniref:Uncharacterized protein n=1 Tax=Bifidobacterium simiarum TaxID=2045441 RepID=A0A2M9HCV2_9BIFI|nr:hypothetical protein [Bifidobacterium simiarum]PJM74631.1 hypothetical protein CSQ87_08815 [Bifidobacterium simiarum]
MAMNDCMTSNGMMSNHMVGIEIVADSPISASACIPGLMAMTGCAYSRKRSQGHPGARSGAETILK